MMIAPLGGNVALDPSLAGQVRLSENNGPGISILPAALNAPAVRLIADWRPFDTVPLAWNPDAPWNSFECIVQSGEHRAVGGARARFVLFGKSKHPRLRFYGENGRLLVDVKYWMPMPAPRTEE